MAPSDVRVRIPSPPIWNCELVAIESPAEVSANGVDTPEVEVAKVESDDVAMKNDPPCERSDQCLRSVPAEVSDSVN
jgi:hypothetical protein